ncbi:MAG: hypothetical protein JW870_00235 [Candidatus Delongbacteria bacterium]|nr:hypothetical protein [Candidatus Delongbacteria bacterium]
MNNNRKPSIGLLIISLFLSSGVILINRFVVEIPEWVAIFIIFLSFIFLIIYMIKARNKKK